jgi:rRNA processing protein Gar1
MGSVKNIIHDGSILIQATETFRPGTPVFDSRGKEVGKVSRVFGPADNPYISVKPKGQINAFGMLDSSLYAGEFKPARRKGVNKWQRKGKPQRR